MSEEFQREAGTTGGGTDGEREPSVPFGWRSWRTWVLVIGVFVAPIVLYSLLLAVPFLPLTTGRKLWVSTGLVVVAEGTFFISALVLGREAVRRYRCFLDLRNWFGKKRR
ncbi:MAG: transporter suffix domain-containing protein [Rubrobacter sp.]|nr:transporter suffix domain-containing protein [Rubrobacter sp.]